MDGAPRPSPEATPEPQCPKSWGTSVATQMSCHNRGPCGPPFWSSTWTQNSRHSTAHPPILKNPQSLSTLECAPLPSGRAPGFSAAQCCEDNGLSFLSIQGPLLPQDPCVMSGRATPFTSHSPQNSRSTSVPLELYFWNIPHQNHPGKLKMQIPYPHPESLGVGARSLHLSKLGGRPR